MTGHYTANPIITRDPKTGEVVEVTYDVRWISDDGVEDVLVAEKLTAPRAVSEAMETDRDLNHRGED